MLIEAAIDRGDVDFRKAEAVARDAFEKSETPRWPLKPVIVDSADYPEW